MGRDQANRGRIKRGWQKCATSVPRAASSTCTLYTINGTLPYRFSRVSRVCPDDSMVHSRWSLRRGGRDVPRFTPSAESPRDYCVPIITVYVRDYTCTLARTERNRNVAVRIWEILSFDLEALARARLVFTARDSELTAPALAEVSIRYTVWIGRAGSLRPNPDYQSYTYAYYVAYKSRASPRTLYRPAFPAECSRKNRPKRNTRFLILGFYEFLQKTPLTRWNILWLLNYCWLMILLTLSG